MNKFIKSQLDSFSTSLIYNEEDLECIIPKNSLNLESQITGGEYYLIKVEDYILNPPENFTLHDNWNKGIKPTDKYMNVEIEKVQGKMIKVNGVGYDYNNTQPLNTMWSGWLPLKSIKIIRSL